MGQRCLQCSTSGAARATSHPVNPVNRCRPGSQLSLLAEAESPYQTCHAGFEIVLGKVDDVVSFDAVYGKVLGIGSISIRFPTS